MSVHALHSLYGGRSARLGVPQADREQVVLTPTWMVEQLRAVEGAISLDPCTSPDNPVRARAFCALELGRDGLRRSWRCRGPFYCNPPYSDLQVWLEKALAEHKRGARGWVLGPVRTQRRWFLPLLRARGVRVFCLAPITFQGHAQTFPGPLFIAGYGIEVPRLVNARGAPMITGRL